MNAEVEMATADGLGSGSSVGQSMAAAVTRAMREWMADAGNVYSGLDHNHRLELLGDVDDAQILRYVARHYEGGVVGFLLDDAN